MKLLYKHASRPEYVSYALSVIRYLPNTNNIKITESRIRRDKMSCPGVHAGRRGLAMGKTSYIIWDWQTHNNLAFRQSLLLNDRLEPLLQKTNYLENFQVDIFENAQILCVFLKRKTVFIFID